MKSTSGNARKKWLAPLLFVLAAAVGVQAFFLVRMNEKLAAFETAQAQNARAEGTAGKGRAAAGDEGASADANTDDSPDPAAPFSLPSALESLFADDVFRAPFDDDVWAGWDPQERLEQMRKQMDEAFGRAFGGLDAGPFLDNPTGANLFQPWLDVREESGQYMITADVPGIKEGELHVEVTGQTVTISGTRKAETREESDLRGGRTLRRERSIGSFRRSITLDEPVRADKVKTEFRDDGVVVIRVPKAEVEPASGTDP